MRWISDGSPLEPMIERSTRLTREELLALADRYDERQSRELRAAVASDFAFGMAWGMLPPQVGALCDVVSDASLRAGISSATAVRAWESVADAMTAELFPGLPPASRQALTGAWDDVSHAAPGG
ncbi:MAG: hypothetical protein ABIO99_02000 [Candidatus Limnocylindria bacterium]